VCANDLKFCTKISGLNLHKMVQLSGKNIFSPIMSKNLSGVPLIIHYQEFFHTEHMYLYDCMSVLLHYCKVLIYMYVALVYLIVDLSMKKNNVSAITRKYTRILKRVAYYNEIKINIDTLNICFHSKKFFFIVKYTVNAHIFATVWFLFVYCHETIIYLFMMHCRRCSLYKS
jgi:hypothetical protein